MQTKLPTIIREQCNTYAGVRRHIRRNEELCSPCLETRRRYMREYQELHREKTRAANNACAAKYRDRRRASAKRYGDENREKLRTKNRQYHYDNPDKTREKARRRRARIKGNGVDFHTEAQVLATYGNICYLCNKPVDLTAPRYQGKAEGWEQGLHIDHVIPISKGGSDTLDNVRPTHALCNLSKNNKLIGDPVEDFEEEIDPSLFEDEDVELEDLDDLEDFEDDEEEED
jgi:5-methylcytosine-specific restriction endonuclease McrA